LFYIFNELGLIVEANKNFKWIVAKDVFEHLTENSPNQTLKDCIGFSNNLINLGLIKN